MRGAVRSSTPSAWFRYALARYSTTEAARRCGFDTRFALLSRRKRLVAHPEAAVDRDDGAGDVAGVVPGEPDDHLRDLRRGGEPPGRDVLLVLGLLRLRQLRRHIGLDEARGDDVRGDASAAELTGDRPGEAHQAALRRRVVHLARAAEEAHHAGDEDDAAELRLE